MNPSKCRFVKVDHGSSKCRISNAGKWEEKEERELHNKGQKAKIVVFKLWQESTSLNQITHDLIGWFRTNGSKFLR